MSSVPQSGAQSRRAAEPQNEELLWFNNDKGFGFVKLADGTEAYLHARVVEAAGRRDVSEGMTLNVTVDDSPRGRQISQLLEVDETTRTGSSRGPQSAEAATGGSDMLGETEGTVKWYNPDRVLVSSRRAMAAKTSSCTRPRSAAQDSRY